jgi:hypothetical protein
MYVSWFFETKSDIQMQENFHTHFRKHPPSHNSIRAWHKKLFKIRSVLNQKRSGQPCTCEEEFEQTREAFQRGPDRST